MLDVDFEGKVGELAVSAKFTAPHGVTSLFGPSGSGKTTITNMIAGFLRPRSGAIRVGGDALFDSSGGVNLAVQDRRIGHVFQDSRLFPHLSVKANLTFARWAGGRSDGRQLDEVVDLLGLEDLLARKPANLSGGEKQRAAIGRALLSSPRLLIMDEPLASLDQARRNDILPYLDKLCQTAHIPILYVSHSMEEVSRLSRTLVIVAKGKTIASGPVAEMMARTDLGRSTGRHEASALLEGKIAGVDKEFDLTHIDIGGGIIKVPGFNGVPGESVRLRIRARDVFLALAPPVGLSIRNALPAEIRSISEEDGPYAELLCMVFGQKLRVRITRSAVVDLKLAPGKQVTALIKSIAIDRRQMGPAPA